MKEETKNEELPKTKQHENCDKKNHHKHECHCEENKKKKGENKSLEHQCQCDNLTIQNQQLQEKLLRISAEVQNMRRRYEDEKVLAAKYEGMELIKNLLPIVDNFERAIAMDTSENEKYLEGFKMIYVNMLTTLKNIGVEEIDCLHKPFDPNYMEAVLTEQIIEEEQGIVLDVLQKGYMYKDKLIRPAMVKVNE